MEWVRIKVLFLVPTYISVPVRAYKSIIELLTKVTEPFEFLVSVRESCFVHENRNKLAERALKLHKKNKLDYVVWLDSDIEFRFNDVLRLIKSLIDSKADMLSGVYYSKISGKVHPLIQVWDRKDDQYYWITPKEFKEKPDVFKSDSVGFGFLVMKPSVLVRMFNEFKRPFNFRVQSNGELLGEDLMFCEQARDLGFKLFVDKRINVGHIKGVTDKSTYEDSLK